MMLFGTCQTIENIGNQILKIDKIASLEVWEAIEWSRSSFLPSFVHTASDMKFTDTCVWLESLCVKSTTGRNLKTQGANW